MTERKIDVTYSRRGNEPLTKAEKLMAGAGLTTAMAGLALFGVGLMEHNPGKIGAGITIAITGTMVFWNVEPPPVL